MVCVKRHRAVGHIKNLYNDRCGWDQKGFVAVCSYHMKHVFCLTLKKMEE